MSAKEELQETMEASLIQQAMYQNQIMQSLLAKTHETEQQLLSIIEKLIKQEAICLQEVGVSPVVLSD